MPVYGIIDILRAILAYYLAKYQYFSMRPGLFDKYHQITYSLQFSVQNQVNVDFTSKNLQKRTKIPLSQFAFYRKCALRFDL